MIRSSHLARWAFAVLALVTGSAPLPAVDLLYVTLGNDTVVTYDTTGNNGANIAATKATIINSNLSGAQGIAINSSNTIFVANFNNYTISKFNSSGTYLGNIAGISNQYESPIAQPIGLAIDSSDNLYVANFADRLIQNIGTYPGSISKYNAQGNFAQMLAPQIGPALVSQPFGLAIDGSGNLFATNYNLTKASKFDASGTFQSFITNSNLANSTGNAVDSSGYLYATSETGNKILKFDSSGNLVSTISTNLNGPRGLTFDSSGNLYAANTGDSTISKFSSSGAFLTSWSTGAAAPMYLANRTVAVPEPSTYALAAIAAGVMGAMARRRKGRNR